MDVSLIPHWSGIFSKHKLPESAHYCLLTALYKVISFDRLYFTHIRFGVSNVNFRGGAARTDPVELTDEFSTKGPHIALVAQKAKQLALPRAAAECQDINVVALVPIHVHDFVAQHKVAVVVRACRPDVEVATAVRSQGS